MAITNKVTRADRCGRARAAARAVLAPGGDGQRHRRRGPRFRHRRAHRARQPRRRARQPRVGRPGRRGRSVRPRHAHRGHHRRQRDRGHARDVSLRGRQRAGRAPVNVRVLGSSGAGRTSDVIAGIDWVIANAQRYGIRVINLSLGHPVANRRRPTRCAVRSRAPSGRHRRRRVGRQLRADGDGRAGPRRHHVARQLAVAITVGALDTHGTVDRSRRSRGALQLARSDAFDFAVKPDVVAPGDASSRSRAQGSSLSTALSSVARRRQRQERLLPLERHEHVGRGGERRRGAAA